MSKLSRPTRIRLLFAAIGVFGAALAISGLFAALPKPAAGGTCGPSTGSETAIQAIVEPGSIGAGPKPPASESAARQQWQAFVDECQSAATGRLVSVIVILAISLAVALLGPVLVLRRKPRTPPASHDATSYAPPAGPAGGPGYGAISGFGVGTPPGGTAYAAAPPGAAPYGLGAPPPPGSVHAATPHLPAGGVATAPPPAWGRDSAWTAPAAPHPPTVDVPPPPATPPAGWDPAPGPTDASSEPGPPAGDGSEHPRT